MSDQEEKAPDRNEHGLSHISEVLENMRQGEKIEVICIDCGNTFEATKLGRLTAKVCKGCGEKRDERQKELERLAQEQAKDQRYREFI